MNPWKMGKQLVWDVTVVDVLAPSRLNQGSSCNPKPTATEAEACTIEIYINSKMKPLSAGRFETEQFKNSYNIVDAHILRRIAYGSFSTLNNICIGDEISNNSTVIRDEKIKRIEMKGSEITIIWTIEEIVVAVLL